MAYDNDNDNDAALHTHTHVDNRQYRWSRVAAERTKTAGNEAGKGLSGHDELPLWGKSSSASLSGIASSSQTCPSRLSNGGNSRVVKW